MSTNKNDYLTIKQNGESQLVIKKSKFICNLARNENEHQAQEFIETISKKYHDATHNTYCLLYTSDAADD